MKRYRGGDQVTRGIYLNLASLEVFQSQDQNGALPEARDGDYIWIPTPLALLLMPLMGLGYVMFRPILGIAGLMAVSAHRLAQLVLPGGREVWRTAFPAWVPGAAYLLGGRRGKGEQPSEAREQHTDGKDELLGKLEGELQERRHSGEK